MDGIKNMEDSILLAIFRMLRKNWKISVKHTYREGNECADWLANRGVANSNNTGAIGIPPVDLKYLLGFVLFFLWA